MLTAMEHGKSVVTPNKAAVAANFEKLLATSREHGVDFRFEASVGGGIPCLTSILEPLSGNRFLEVSGILNGTTNYIMSKMYDEGLDYDVILKDAQEKGFAEADPTADVEGIDCANKLSILIYLCFGKYIAPMDIPRTGITGVDKAAIDAARAAGNKIKLLSFARMDENGDVECYIKPVELPLSHPLAGVNNEYNAIYVTGNMVDDVMLYGKGAGPHPTGSAVAGDVIKIMREESR
jgi:homoserine dehydrogenase